MGYKSTARVGEHAVGDNDRPGQQKQRAHGHEQHRKHVEHAVRVTQSGGVAAATPATGFLSIAVLAFHLVEQPNGVAASTHTGKSTVRLHATTAQDQLLLPTYIRVVTPSDPC